MEKVSILADIENILPDENSMDQNTIENKTELIFETIDTILKTASEEIHFSLADYIIFSLMLASSLIIGIYFGFISKKKQDNTKEYLLGGKTMKTYPISASLIASHISGVTLLGVPAELYAHGTQYWVHIVSALLIAVLLNFVYLPVFYDLQLTSCFTYLEIRFDRKVRLTASFIYALTCLLFIPIVIYVPALAFNQVTGVNLNVITPIISFVCIFYTAVGGLRAVVWTDTLQFVLMMIAIVVVMILGILSVGGFFNAWRIADNGGRLIFFNMNPSPFVRSSFWTVSIGLTTTWLSNLGVNQSSVQRFLAVPDIKMARKSVWIFAIGLVVIKGFTCYTGLLMYARYETCDPITTGVVKKLDQMLPYYVMDIAGQIPGLPGLFIAGIFAAALSSMSTSLNTLAGTIFEDFIKPNLLNVSEKTASNWMKCCVVVLGIIELLLVFVVQHLGAVFSMALSIQGLSAGTLLGIFTTGMVLPKVNTTGVITGAIASMITVGWLAYGAQSLPAATTLPLRTDGCDISMLNSTLNNVSTTFPIQIEDINKIFTISFMYYSVIGFMIVFIVGYPVSLLTSNSKVVHEILLTPLCRSKEYRKGQKLVDTMYREDSYLEIGQKLLAKKIVE